MDKKECLAEAKGFLHRLLGDPKRRIALLLAWHTFAPSKENKESVNEIWHSFVDTLLFAPLDVCVDNNGLYLFSTLDTPFFISYAQLSGMEQAELSFMVKHKKMFFREEKTYYGDHIRLRGFIANKSGFTPVMRASLLRDFCSLVYDVIPPFRLCLSMVLQRVGIERSYPLCILLSSALIGRVPDGPALTPLR